MGGCLLNATCGGERPSSSSCTATRPELVGPPGRHWLRGSGCEPHPASLAPHPLKDAYWKQAHSRGLRRDRVSGFAVGGWADGYASAIPRCSRASCSMSRSRRSVGALVPHDASIGPSIGFLRGAAGWHGCLGERVGDGSQPPSRSTSRARATSLAIDLDAESVPPGFHGDRPYAGSPRRAGRPAHAPESSGSRRAGSVTRPSRRAWRSLRPRHGSGSPTWVAAGMRDQREDDARSPVSIRASGDRLEILGAAEVRSSLASDRPAAFLVARSATRAEGAPPA